MYLGGSTVIFVVNSRTQALFNKPFVPDDIICLARLIQNALVDTSPKGFLAVPEVLATSDKKIAHVGLWPFAYLTAGQANDKIAEISKKAGAIKTRKCYVGKRLIPTAESYAGILPPGNMQHGKTFRKLIDAGINHRFYQEFLGINLARCVQDRVKFRGITSKLFESRDNEVVALALKDKMGSVYFFCG